MYPLLTCTPPPPSAMAASKPRKPSARNWLHRLLVTLVALGFLTLVAQMSSLLGRSGEQLTGTSRFRRAMNLGMSWRRRGDNYSAELPATSSPEVHNSSFEAVEVSVEDSLHLSLLHECCVSDVDTVLPWQFGSPGHQLANATASNPEVVKHRNDSDLLQTLRQCPDVDIFLPSHLHGNGYCEDAVAYAKCELRCW
jgi:hypothetical protein